MLRSSKWKSSANILKQANSNIDSSTPLSLISDLTKEVKPDLEKAFRELTHLTICILANKSMSKSSGDEKIKARLQSCHESLVKVNQAVDQLLKDSESAFIELTIVVGNMENARKQMFQQQVIGTLQVAQLSFVYIFIFH